MVWAAACLLMLSGCGFRFPTSFNQLPPSLAVLHVTVSGSPLRDPPLLKAAVRAVRAAGGHIRPEPGVPLLTLTNEYFVPQVLVVDTTGRVAAYLLDYALSFQLQDASGRVLVPMRTVKLQREYTFSRFNVLGESRQQRHLKHEMRAEAIRKVLFQLAALRPQPGKAQ